MIDSETSFYLKRFCMLYDEALKTSSVHKLKPRPGDEEWEAFRTCRGMAPALVSTITHHRIIPAYSPFFKFYNANKLFWIIPCAIPGGVAGFVLRAFKVSDPKLKFMHFSVKGGADLMYGWEDFYDFKPESRTPIILTEGIKDALYLKQFHPYTLACLTSSINDFMLVLLARLTDRVALAFDSDTAGTSGMKRVYEKLRASSVKAVLLPPMEKKSDWGGCWRSKNFTPRSKQFVEAILKSL